MRHQFPYKLFKKCYFTSFLYKKKKKKWQYSCNFKLIITALSPLFKQTFCLVSNISELVKLHHFTSSDTSCWKAGVCSKAKASELYLGKTLPHFLTVLSENTLSPEPGEWGKEQHSPSCSGVFWEAQHCNALGRNLQTFMCEPKRWGKAWQPIYLWTEKFPSQSYSISEQYPKFSWDMNTDMWYRSLYKPEHALHPINRYTSLTFST